MARRKKEEIAEEALLSEQKLKQLEQDSLDQFKTAYKTSYEMCSSRQNCKGCIYKTWRKGKCLGEYFYKILKEVYKNSKKPLTLDEEDEEINQTDEN